MHPLLNRVRSLVLVVAARLDPFIPLLTRVALGVLFVKSGWGKLNNFPNVIKFFDSLGIPMPAANAALATATEFGGGALLVLGLGTRLVSLPLAFTMMVATATARRDDIEGWNSFFQLPEVLFVLLFFWLFVRGPGPYSLDAVLEKRFGTKA